MYRHTVAYRKLFSLYVSFKFGFVASQMWDRLSSYRNTVCCFVSWLKCLLFNQCRCDFQQYPDNCKLSRHANRFSVHARRCTRQYTHMPVFWFSNGKWNCIWGHAIIVALGALESLVLYYKEEFIHPLSTDTYSSLELNDYK